MLVRYEHATERREISRRDVAEVRLKCRVETGELAWPMRDLARIRAAVTRKALTQTHQPWGGTGEGSLGR